MGEITEAGYQSMREFAFSAHTVPNQWDYIALYDSSQSEVVRVSITGDSRFYWTDLDGDEVGTVQGEVSGNDSDIPTDGTTIEYTAIWDSATGGRQITQLEQVASMTFNQTGDAMNVTHNVQIPQIV